GMFVTNITSRASTDAGPVMTVQGLVPGTTGTFHNLLATTALGTGTTSTSLTSVVHVAPWVSTATNQRVPFQLPKKFRVITTYASTEDITYSVGVDLNG
ncbi:MAG: hypothetical protein L0Z49_12770, partial [Actinobacteria bacterium]|nr:hypothetical protein [Actinomycetota bacterium]